MSSESDQASRSNNWCKENTGNRELCYHNRDNQQNPDRGYQRNDLVSSTHPKKKFARKKETEKEPVGLNTSALCRVDLSIS